MESAEVLSRLGKLNPRLGIWNQKVNYEFSKLWDMSHLPPGGLTPEMKEALTVARVRAGESPEEELYDLLDELGDIYLRSETKQRNEIRRIVAANREVLGELGNYTARGTNLLKSTGEARWLYLGLIAASIEDLQVDYRDTLVLLGDLLLAAKQVGIDPLPVFQEIASLSNPDVTAVGSSTQNALANFHKTAYYKKSIQPELDKLS